MGCSRIVRGTLVKYFFKFNSQTHQSYIDRFLKNLQQMVVAEDLLDSIVVEEIIQTEQDRMSSVKYYY